MNKKYTQDEIDFLKENYHKYSTSDLMKMTGRTRHSLCFKAGELGIRGNKKWASVKTGELNRKYSLNYDYFSKIDTHEKAYWYGFIWADGCVTDKGYLIVDLHNKDLEHLKIFHKHIQSTYKIGSSKQMVRLCMKSDKLISDLNGLNILPRKTYLDNLPVIEDEFFFSWLMGLFDGDGFCDMKALKICTRPVIANWISSKLLNYGIESRIYAIKNKQNVILSISHKTNIELAARLMTENITFNLERKHPRYRNVKTLQSSSSCSQLHVQDNHEHS